MAVKGKRKYSFYLEEKQVELLKKYLDSRPNTGGLSELVGNHIDRLYRIVKNNPEALNEIEPGKMTVKKFWKLLKLDMNNV